MTEFEFLSVLISIIFGLALTHILSGSIRAIYAGRTTENHLVYTGFVLVVMVLNWWVIFSWRDHQHWSFDVFLLLVFWAISHYVLAITLYPPGAATAADFEIHRRWFFCAFIAMALLDIGQTAMRGDLFRPWYYLLFVLHYAVLAILALKVSSKLFQRVLSWWFLLSILIWSLMVRRFL